MSDQQLNPPYVEVGQPSFSSNLDLFTDPLLATGVEKCFYTELWPNAPLSDTSTTITFDLEGGPCYLDLVNSYVFLTIKVLNNDNSAIPAYTAEASVGTINAPLATCFRDLEIRVNDVGISSTYGTYAYTSMFQLLLNYSHSAIETKLSLMGFNRDTNPNENDAFGSISGFKERAARTALSANYSMMGPILGHYFHSINRYFMNMTKISWTWLKNTSDFCLKSNVNNANFKYSIQDMRMYIRKVQLYPSQLMKLENQLASQNAKYPLCHYYTKEITVPAAARFHHFTNILSSQFIPKRCILALVAQSNFIGEQSNSPFAFQPFNLTDAYFSSDNKRYPSQPFNLNFNAGTDQDWTRGYFSLFKMRKN